MTCKTKISRTIKSVDIKKWNNLADIIFLKTDILEIVEKLTLGRNSYYLEIYDNNILCAIAVFYGQTNSLYSSLDEATYGKYYKILRPVFGLNPSLICYFPYSPFYKMFSIKKNYKESEIFKIISDELYRLAKKEGYKSCAFLGVENRELIKNQKNFLSIFSGYKVRLPLESRSFEDFLHTLKKSHRNTIKKDIKRFEKSSTYSSRTLNNVKSEEMNKILNLFNENFSKYTGSKKEEMNLMQEFIRELNKNSNSIVYFLGENNKKLFSALMTIEDEERLIGLRVGQKENDNKEGFAFYNIAIYEPLKYAINNSKRYFELGTGSYKYKIRRGAQIHNSYNLIKPMNRFKYLYLIYIIAILNFLNKKKHQKRLD